MVKKIEIDFHGNDDFKPNSNYRVRITPEIVRTMLAMASEVRDAK